MSSTINLGLDLRLSVPVLESINLKDLQAADPIENTDKFALLDTPLNIPSHHKLTLKNAIKLVTQGPIAIDNADITIDLNRVPIIETVIKGLDSLLPSGRNTVSIDAINGAVAYTRIVQF